MNVTMPKIGQIWAHTKSKRRYKITGFTYDAYGNLYVVHEGEHERSWAREINDFLSLDPDYDFTHRFMFVRDAA